MPSCSRHFDALPKGSRAAWRAVQARSQRCGRQGGWLEGQENGGLAARQMNLQDRRECEKRPRLADCASHLLHGQLLPAVLTRGGACPILEPRSTLCQQHSNPQRQSLGARQVRSRWNHGPHEQRRVAGARRLGSSGTAATAATCSGGQPASGARGPAAAADSRGGCWPRLWSQVRDHTPSCLLPVREARSSRTFAPAAQPPPCRQALAVLRPCAICA